MVEVMTTWRNSKRRSESLSAVQIKSLRKVARIHSFKASMIVALILDTGIRVTDLLNLEWSNIAQEERCIYFKQGKTNKQVRARISKATLELLNNWKDVSKGDKIIPITRSTVGNIIKKIAKDAGISRPVSPHDLCATAMSMAAWQKLPMKFAETQYGRTGRIIAKYYQKIPPDIQDKLFDEAFNDD